MLADVLSRDYDVEIVGSHFKRYGTRLWEPLRGESRIPVRAFAGRSFPEYFAVMEEMAEALDGDVVYACKARLPSAGIGVLAKLQRNRPLILDVDDRELSFFGLKSGLTLAELEDRRTEEDFLVPHGALWTQYCDTLVARADGVTVSNHVLAGLYGGEIVPHVRDEEVFDPAHYDREKARAELGLDVDARVVLFVGTPRAHKGLRVVAEALAALGDRRNRLVIVGSLEAAVGKELEPFRSVVQVLPPQPFAKLPSILTAGDVVCALQDPASEIARYQIPAKITDALAMAVPCVATRVPPIEPLISSGAVLPADGALDDLLGDVLSNLDEHRRRAAAGRETFLRSFSYAAARARLTEVISGRLADVPPVDAELEELVAFQRAEFAGRRRTVSKKTVSGLRAASSAPPATNGGAKGRGRARPRSVSYDLVVFWKQNDSGIYGRRQDMLVKYLAESNRINKIVHFDHPIDLRSLLALRLRKGYDQSGLVFEQTLRRVLGRAHGNGVKAHTFLHRTRVDCSTLSFERLLPPEDEYVAYVERTLARHDIGSRDPVVFWVYPRNLAFPAIAESLEPDLVVADVVDDHRTWPGVSPAQIDALSRNYREILERSDLVFANCPQVKAAMEVFRRPIHLLPNACEPPEADGTSPRRPPRELRRLGGPIVGYVGNLSARIDVDLLDHVAEARPDWQLVLIGSTHAGREALRIAQRDNVHFLGVKPYAEVASYVRAFDVAIIPHVDDEMTRSMNPLKAFLYCAQGVPVVSTAIANLGELQPLVRIADNADAFVEEIERALASEGTNGRNEDHDGVLLRNSWPVRVQEVLRLLDSELLGWPA